MLKSQKIPALTQAQPTHVDLFVEYYDLLKRWALQFTDRDQERAEDLLHDLFIHFTLARPDLDVIENVEGYLYVVMRNLHLSQVRRATRTPLRQLSAVEFDTVDMGFWASDPRDRIRMRDELGAVCQYACLRKESSKAGSVLILRFFHGYYPEEISRVMRTSRGAVKDRLQLARAEVQLYLEDPNRLSFIGDKPAKSPKLAVEHLGDDLRLELRAQIFRSRQGECFTKEMLYNLYESENADGPAQRTLAHIVSCAKCLDEINDLLKIPRLASRYPLDTIGKDPGRKGTGGGSGGSGGPKMLDSYISRRNAHYYHEPRELCISVNGQLQSSQKIGSSKIEITLIIDMFESLGFVEVLSEIGIRLLLLPIEPPPVGEAKQAARIELSDGRTVDANLSFGSGFPTLQVTYNDPTLEPETVLATEFTETVSSEGVQKPSAIPFKSDKPGLLSFLAGWKSLLQPARLTAAFATLLIAALLIFKFAPLGTVSAAELLQKSMESEEARLANKDRVLHRTLDLEELKDGQVTARRKIDVWQSAEKGITARRLYDEQGRLAAGDWRRADGIQTIYKPGQPARLQPLPEKRGANITFDDAWQLSVSAKEFIALLDRIEHTQVETRANDYLISYTPMSEPGAVATGFPANGITKAAIVLSKEDLHAIEQTFTLGVGDETREFRMVESGYDWKPLNAVAPAVFEPNVELTSLSSPPNKGGVADVSSDGVVVPDEVADMSNSDSAPAANIATAALEVEIVEALNNAGAFMGEQISVQRTSDGKVSVTALVETDKRKRDLLTALAAHKNDPAVRIKIETVAEAEARTKKLARRGQSVSPGTVDQIQATEGESPVFADLKKRFTDDEARRFSDRALGRMRQAWLHAVAMKQISQRFSAADLQSLSPAERNRWILLIRGHAAQFVSEAEAMRRELNQVFPEAAAGNSTGGAIGSDAELQARVRDLYEASVSLDRGMDRSFSLGSSGSGAPVKTAAFWRTFAQAMGLARTLSSAK